MDKYPHWPRYLLAAAGFAGAGSLVSYLWGIMGAAIGGRFYGGVGSLGPSGIWGAINAGIQAFNGAAAATALGMAGNELGMAVNEHCK
jgi:hypothetical protein